MLPMMPMVKTNEKIAHRIENTMPMMPQTLPPVVLPLLPANFTALDASTMATIPRTMPTMGMKENTIARMPQMSAPVALPFDGAG